MALSPLDRVRESARFVMERAELVQFDLEKLARFARSLDPDIIRGRYIYAEDFHFEGGPEALLGYIFTLDALNFGSGFSPQWKAQRQGKSTYKNVAAALKKLADGRARRGASLDAAFAAAVTEVELAEQFGVDPHFELIKMYRASLNQLGRFVLANFEGGYGGLLASLRLPGRAASLVKLLAENLSLWNDRGDYKGEAVFFYKRAQILANDLYLAFEGQPPGDFDDISLLTSFADNLIPHFFRVEEVLSYDPKLAQEIERGEIIGPGSAAETEIRAAGVFCVEETCRILGEKSGERGSPIFPAQLDLYLWNRAQDPRYKSHPRHLTPGYFY